MGFSAKTCFFCLEAFFDVIRSENRRGRERDNVGVRSKNFVDGVKPDERRFGGHFPYILKLVRIFFFDKFADGFSAKFELFGENVAESDDFDILVGVNHVCERRVSAASAADESDFYLVGTSRRNADSGGVSLLGGRTAARRRRNYCRGGKFCIAGKKLMHTQNLYFLF